MTAASRRAPLRRTAVVLAAIMIVLLASAPAQAHSELQRSDPPNGGMVSPGRDFLTLWFGEPISASASRFDLRLADGTGVDAVVSSVEGAGTVVRLDTASLDRGSYELAWRIVSLSDGHFSTGTLAFGAGMRPDVLPSADSSLPGSPLLAVHWLDLSALMMAIGALAVSGRVLASLGEAAHRAQRLARTTAVAASVAAVYAGLLTPFLRTRPAGNPADVWLTETWATLAGTPWGHVWIAREAAVVAAALLIWRWARTGGTSGRPLVTARCALLAVSLLEARAGHAADVAGYVATLASAAHLVAAGVWAGGLVVLILCLAPTARLHPELRRSLVSEVWRGFSPMAVVASVVLLSTGLYEAGVYIPDLVIARSTVYGGAVGAKTLLVTIALVLAAMNALVVHPGVAEAIGRRLGRGPGWTPIPLGRFTAVVVAEACLLVAAGVAAAVVTSTPTAREVATATQDTAPRHEEVNGLYITFEGVPRGPARVSLVVRLHPTVLPVPAPVREVWVSLDGPSGASEAVSLPLVEEGRYEVEVPRPSPGGWTATVTVLREGQADTVSHAAWAVAEPDVERATPLQVVTTILAVLLLVVLGTFLWWSRRRHVEHVAAAPAHARTPQGSSR